MKKPNWYTIGAALLLALIGVVLIIVSQNSNDKKEAAASPRTVKVVISSQGFNPANLLVKKGTKIIWTNTDTVIHQIYANPHPTGKSLPSLKSEILNNNQTYEYTANTTGSYGYHDQLNPTINGTIEVTK